MSIRRQDGSYTMEAVALVAALCVVGIFVFSHLARQSDDDDQAARRYAEGLAPKVEAIFRADPDTRLTVQLLKDSGADPPAPLQVEVPPDNQRAGDWRVKVWHPDGRRVYTAGAQGVTSDFR